MTSIEERQRFSSVFESSRNIEALIAPMKDWVRKQGEADEKTSRRKDLWAARERCAKAIAGARGRLLTGTSRS